MPERRNVLRTAVLTTVVAVAVGVAWAWLEASGRPDSAQILDLAPSDFVADSSRGELIFHLGGCADCHLVRDTESPWFGTLAGGGRLETRFGTFHPPNITPDPGSGIGNWSLEDFVGAMVLGSSPGGEHYYPSFPYTAYAGSSVADLLDLKAFLDEQAPAMLPNTPHDLRFPFNLRSTIGLWKLLFHDVEQFRPDDARSEEWNRGAYIVNTLGHCGACHTPRNLFLAERKESPFSGGSPLAPGAKSAPPIAGLDSAEILNALDEWSGAVSENSAMFLVTLTFSQHVSIADAEAVATYLSSLDP